MARMTCTCGAELSNHEAPNDMMPGSKHSVFYV